MTDITLNPICIGIRLRAWCANTQVCCDWLLQLIKCGLGGLTKPFAILLACSHTHTHQSLTRAISLVASSPSRCLSSTALIHTLNQALAHKARQFLERETIEKLIGKMLLIIHLLPVLLFSIPGSSALPQTLRQLPLNSTQLDPIQQVSPLVI